MLIRQVQLLKLIINLPQSTRIAITTTTITITTTSTTTTTTIIVIRVYNIFPLLLLLFTVHLLF
jgi:hypothetical protein